jgi:alkylation response protein AidB-like acyl-CoA dehydrogenase
MDFELTGDQKMIRETARDFAESRIAPEASRHDAAEEFPAGIVRGLAELGFMGMFVPESYGGAGTDHLSYVLAIEEISRADAATGVIVSVNNSLVCQPILDHGSEDQKRRYLPKLARGEWLGCFSLSEPGSGSDAAALTTTARKDGATFVLDGTKNFVTNGPQADVALVFARTGEPGHKGVSAFLVEKGTQGFSVGSIDRKLGIRASHSCELVFDGCRVPASAVLGAVGGGFRVALATLDGGRIGIAAQACGLISASLDAATRYARDRRQFGRPIAEFQAIQWFLADMKTSLDAARLLTHRAAWLQDFGASVTLAASTAKLFAAEAAVRAAIKAVQVHGGAGYMKEYPVERYMRDAKVTEIYEGTSEIQRMVIAARVLKGEA